MEQQIPIGLQVALYTASGAIVVLTAVLVHAALRLQKQLDRVVTAVESFEAEITPLARETRVVVDQLRDLSERVHGQWLALEGLIETVARWTHRTQRAVESAEDRLLSPVRNLNRTTRLVRTGVTTFLTALWTGRRQSQQKARVS